MASIPTTVNEARISVDIRRKDLAAALSPDDYKKAVAVTQYLAAIIHYDALVFEEATS